MDIFEALRPPEHSEPVDPEDEIRFRYMDNPFPMKSCRAKNNVQYLTYKQEHWHLPPPLPGISDLGTNVLGIPAAWYRMALGCEDGEPNRDRAALPVVIAIWDEAKEANRRQVMIGEGFLKKWSQEFRSTDRALKNLHSKSLLIYTITNRRRKRRRSVLLLPTPYVDERETQTQRTEYEFCCEVDRPA